MLPNLPPIAQKSHFPALLLIMALQVMLLLHYFEPAISSPDANGYMKQARLIATEGRTWFERESPLHYINVHWLQGPGDRVYSRYPPGYPLAAAGLYLIAGPAGAVLLNILYTVMTLLGVYLICRAWIGGWWGVMAAAAMAVNPTAILHASVSDSHAATAFFLIWGIYALIRWTRSNRIGWALAAGCCFGYIPTIRYAEGLFLPAAASYVWLYRREHAGFLSTVVAFSAGAIVPLGCLLLRNVLAYGALSSTGYDDVIGQTAFSLRYFAEHLNPYLRNILSQGGGYLLPCGAAGIAVLCARRSTLREGIMLAALIVPITLLYMAYYFAPGEASTTLRFLLPTFYLYAIAGVWLLKIFSETERAGVQASAAVLLILTVFWGLPQAVHALQMRRASLAPLTAVTGALREHVPAGSVVIAGENILQHLDFIRGWKLLDETLLTGRNMRGGMPEDPPREGDQSSPMPRHKMEERRRLAQRYQVWSGFGPNETFFEDLHAWAPQARQVYWIGNPEQIEHAVPDPSALRIIAQVDLPDSDLPDRTAGMRGMRGGRRPGMMGGPGGGMGFITPGMDDEGELVIAEWILPGMN